MAEPTTLHKQYPLLDLLRFVAAVMVVAFHLIGTNTRDIFWHRFLPSGSHPQAYYSHVSDVWFLGYIGVQIFFSISGFIISVSASNSKSGFDFFERRLLRILPALWICTAIAAALFAAYGLLPLPQIVGMSLRSAFLVPFGPYIDGVVWTIIIEMVFYMLVCAFIGICGREKIARLGYGLIVVSAVFWLAIATFPAMATPTVMLIAPRLLLEHGAFFGIGIVLSVLDRPGRQRWNCLFLLIGLAPACLQIEKSSGLIFAEFGAYGASPYAWKATLIWFASVIVLYIGTNLANSDILKRRRDTIRQIGLMTYPLYLVHFTAGQFIFAQFVALTTLPLYLDSTFTIAIVVAIAWLIAKYPEVLLRNLMRKPFDLIFATLKPSRYMTAKGETSV